MSEAKAREDGRFDSNERRHSEAKRREAIKLYLDLGNYCWVGRSLGVDRVAVMHWVREQAEQTPESPTEAATRSSDKRDLHHFPNLLP